MQEDMNSDQVKREAKHNRKAHLEQRFLEAWGRMFPQLPRPVMQHQFHPHRKWRFDFAWVAVSGGCAVQSIKLAVEIDGGSFMYGGHNRGAQQQKDYEKMNHAVKLGWRVLRFNTADMKDPETVVTFVAEVLTRAKDVA